MLRPVPDRFYHATPLHYAPHLLATGVLYSQAELKRLSLPIRPRPTAARRDRKLKLDRYVHLSFTPVTPLLKHKLAFGYPHVLLEFSPQTLDITGAAICKYNSKSWRHREEFTPITDRAEQAAVMEAWCTGRYPSAEVLIPDSLPLAPLCARIQVASAEIGDWLAELCRALGFPEPPAQAVTPEHFRDAAPFDFAPYREYGDACRAVGQVLPPPNLPFD